MANPISRALVLAKITLGFNKVMMMMMMMMMMIIVIMHMMYNTFLGKQGLVEQVRMFKDLYWETVGDKRTATGEEQPIREIASFSKGTNPPLSHCSAISNRFFFFDTVLL